MVFFTHPREAFFIICKSKAITMERTNGSVNLLLRADSLVILPILIPVRMATPTSIRLLRRPLRIPSVKTFSVTGICGTLMEGGVALLVLLKKFLKLNPAIAINCPREVTGRPRTSQLKSNIHCLFDVIKMETTL